MNDESEALVPVEPSSDLDVHRQATRDYARASKASATWRAYRTDLDDFAAWCDQHSLESLPAAPETVAAYLSDLATRLKVSTVQRRVSAISQAHKAAGLETPTSSAIVRLTMKGIRRIHAPSQTVRQAAPAVTATIRKFVHPLAWFRATFISCASRQRKRLLLQGVKLFGNRHCSTGIMPGDTVRQRAVGGSGEAASVSIGG